MGPRAVNFSEEDRVILNKLNTLLLQLHAPYKLKSVSDVGAGVFVTLYEGLCGEQLQGIIRSPNTKEDEIHNCQIVIDSLAGDVLHTSLTHIAGADIIDGNRESILNLAEIFSGLLEYMLNKIESDVSTDNEDDHPNLTTDDPDLLSHEVIDEILDSELRQPGRFSGFGMSHPSASWEEPSPIRKVPDGYTTQDLIQGTEDATFSPTKGAANDTAELIRESEAIHRRLGTRDQPVTAPPPWAPAQPRETTVPAREITVPARETTPEERQSGPSEDGVQQQSPMRNGRKSPATAEEPDEGLARERERRDEIIRRLENDPRYKYMLPPTQTQTEERDEASDETFRTLQSMVEETAQMARAAVDASPSRAQRLLDNLEAGRAQRRRDANTRSPSARQSRFASPPGQYGVTGRSRYDQARPEGRAKRVSPSARRHSPKQTDRLSDTELTPSKAKRKVSFLVERSLTDSSPSLDYGKPPVRKAWDDIGQKSYGRSGKSSAASGSYLAYDDNSDKENDSYEVRLRKQYEEIVKDVLSDDESPDRLRDKGQLRTRRFNKLDVPKASYTVGGTRRVVDQEKQAANKKIGFLQKIYREDLDELLDEADYLMDKNRQAAKEMEKKYQKKMQAGVKAKPGDKVSEGSSVLKKKTKKPAQFVSSKAKKTAPTKSLVKAAKKPLTIQDEEDILPMLLDEFPHLHLSLHTWHELWRKGLQQIEQITRSHQEVRRKKSLAQNQSVIHLYLHTWHEIWRKGLQQIEQITRLRQEVRHKKSLAQNQLEEAEKRQEIMVNIMKKELEHSQRLKEIKDRQSSALVAKNRLHERRMQSARSRHYYDEYQVRMRSKMLKRRTREEMVFKKLFKDGLDIQKERIRELRKYAKEQRTSQARSQRDEIESMENYYRDQFQILAENIAKEKKDLTVREKAQQKVMETMKKELRKKMETEIKLLQEQLVRDDDDAYFRQLDADRVVRDLQMAKYQVKV